MNIAEEINKLKKEKNAVILAHYYVEDEVQQLADYVGDSFYLSQMAAQTDADIIVFAGVSFMGESAAIINPSKKVLMPDASADCPMAHMADIVKIEAMREKYHDMVVVCYINSTAELKSYSDVCVTSANAVKIVKALPNEHIYFIPDGNLGRYVREQVKEKHIICNDGYCPVHQNITKESVVLSKKAHPHAEFLAHPECTWDVLQLADYVGSTSGIIDHVKASESKEFIIGTETGVLYELRLNNKDKEIYPVEGKPCCSDMKLITPEKIKESLLKENFEIRIDEELRKKAYRPLEMMLKLGRQ